MSNDAVSKILVVILMVMIFILIVLACVYVFIKLKSRKKIKKEDREKVKITSDASIISQSYSKQSIFKFMEFDTIEDNMIIQKDGKRFLMVIECQGINYDLMSSMEKVSVEEGFLSFLNTLRHSIQIYIQTRTINLEESVSNYKIRLKDIEDKLNKMKIQYDMMKEAGTYSKEELDKLFFEITKQTNLYEYGKDIIKNTESMSADKNILNKNYYIIISYYAEEIGNSDYDIEEIKNIAFSELYTKAQSLIRTLTACSVVGKVMNSNELLELLYMAYNRDEAEVFGVNKALRAGYDELYSTAPDILNKKLKVLDEEINKKALERANEAIEEVKTEKELEIQKKEEQKDKLIAEIAKIILEKNKAYIGEEVAKEAKEKIDMEGEKEDVQEKRKTKRTARTSK